VAPLYAEINKQNGPLLRGRRPRKPVSTPDDERSPIQHLSPSAATSQHRRCGKYSRGSRPRTVRQWSVATAGFFLEKVISRTPNKNTTRTTENLLISPRICRARDISFIISDGASRHYEWITNSQTAHLYMFTHKAKKIIDRQLRQNSFPSQFIHNGQTYFGQGQHRPRRAVFGLYNGQRTQI